jgi:hypothetical protein
MILSRQVYVSRPHHVVSIFFILIAHVLEDVGVGLQEMGELHRERLVVIRRIIKGHLHVAMPYIPTMHPPCDLHVLAAWMAQAIEGAVV